MAGSGVSPNYYSSRSQDSCIASGGNAQGSRSAARVSHNGPSCPPINGTYGPASSPPTPAPSPTPSMLENITPASDRGIASITESVRSFQDSAAAALAWSSLAPFHLQYLTPSALDALITSTLPHLNSAQLAHLGSLLPPRLKRDFLADLPPEIALHILGFVDDVQTLARAGQVSRVWRALVIDEAAWKIMCARRGFELEEEDAAARSRTRRSTMSLRTRESGIDARAGALASVWTTLSGNATSSQNPNYPKARLNHAMHIPAPLPFSYRKHFKMAHLTESNWRHSGRLLRSHRSPDPGVVTSLAMDGQWIVVGLANSSVHVFSASTGVRARTLVGHSAGVWSLWLVSKGGGAPCANTENMRLESSEAGQDDGSWASRIPQSLRAGMGMDPTSSPESHSDSSSSSSSDEMPFQSVFDSLRPPASDTDCRAEGNENSSARQSDPCNASRGWGQTNALVISGGCDKQIRVWDIKSGYCLYTLRGHRSTIRCLKVFHGRPVAVSGSRDHTLRVWDVQKGVLLRTLEGHTDSVRCLDVYGDKVVSGSYDCTVRLWDVDTGQCLRVFNGHYHQVYTVAFDGERIASGGLDTTVRIWSASTGSCLALLQGHTALVCQLQLSSRTNTIITGSADGRIIIFSIAPAHVHAVQRYVPVATPQQSDLFESPPLSPSGLTAVRDNAGADTSEYRMLTRVPAHSSSVTGLQFDDRPGRRWVVSGGTDGRVQLWEMDDGSEFRARAAVGDATRGGGEMRLIRDLTEPCEGLWKVAFRGDLAVICCLRAGRTVLEIWSFRPVEEDL